MTAGGSVSPSVSPSVISNDDAREEKTANEEPIPAIVDALRALGLSEANAVSAVRQVGKNAHLLPALVRYGKANPKTINAVAQAISLAARGIEAPTRGPRYRILENDRGAEFDIAAAAAMKRKLDAAMSHHPEARTA